MLLFLMLLLMRQLKCAERFFNCEIGWHLFWGAWEPIQPSFLAVFCVLMPCLLTHAARCATFKRQVPRPLQHVGQGDDGGL